MTRPYFQKHRYSNGKRCRCKNLSRYNDLVQKCNREPSYSHCCTIAARRRIDK